MLSSFFVFSLQNMTSPPYLCPITKRTMMPFSSSNFLSFSPEQLFRKPKRKFTFSRFIYTQLGKTAFTLWHPCRSYWVTSLTTTKGSVNTNDHEVFSFLGFLGYVKLPGQWLPLCSSSYQFHLQTCNGFI